MVDPIEFVTISKARLEKLQKGYRELRSLERYGVDNWEGYDEAMRDLYGDGWEDEGEDEGEDE